MVTEITSKYLKKTHKVHEIIQNPVSPKAQLLFKYTYSIEL